MGSSREVRPLPAGDGVNTRGLVAGGYEVVAGDLFPDACAGENYEVAMTADADDKRYLVAY